MNRIGNVEEAIRTISAESVDSVRSERSVDSDQVLGQLHRALDNLPETTIELRRPPKPNPPIPFFRCEKCRDCAFQSLADLVAHSRESHELFEVAELFNRHKIYRCPKCQVQFRSAFHLGLHIKQQPCESVSKKSKSSLFTQFDDGNFKCNRCQYTCKSKPVMSKHVKYGHFQNMDCFVSRCDALRQSALELKAANLARKAEQSEKQAEKRIQNREKKLKREENKKRKIEEEKVKVEERLPDPSGNVVSPNLAELLRLNAQKVLFERAVVISHYQNLLNSSPLIGQLGHSMASLTRQHNQPTPTSPFSPSPFSAIGDFAQFPPPPNFVGHAISGLAEFYRQNSENQNRKPDN